MKRIVPAACSVVFASPHGEDHGSLAHLIDHPVWTLQAVTTASAAILCARRAPVGIILVAEDLPGGWRLVLDGVKDLRHPPRVVVCSPAADEKNRLNARRAGASELLALPFDHTEFFRTLMGCWEQWKGAAPADLRWGIAAVA